MTRLRNGGRCLDGKHADTYFGPITGECTCGAHASRALSLPASPRGNERIGRLNQFGKLKGYRYRARAMARKAAAR